MSVFVGIAFFHINIKGFEHLFFLLQEWMKSSSSGSGHVFPLHIEIILKTDRSNGGGGKKLGLSHYSPPPSLVVR